MLTTTETRYRDTFPPEDDRGGLACSAWLHAVLTATCEEQPHGVTADQLAREGMRLGAWGGPLPSVATTVRVLLAEMASNSRARHGVVRIGVGWRPVVRL